MKPKGRKAKKEQFDWNDENVQFLISLWEEQSILYNVNHPHYNDKNKRKIAIGKIRDEFLETGAVNIPSHDAILEKINGLRSYYVTQRNKYEQSKKSGAGAADVFKIRWHFYDKLSFLADFVTPRSTHSNISSRKKENDDEVALNSAYKIPNDVGKAFSKKIELKRSNDLIEGALDSLADLKKRKVDNEQKNIKTEKSKDQIFCDMACTVLSEVPEGMPKDLLKMDIMRLIYTAKHQSQIQIQTSYPPQNLTSPPRPLVTHQAPVISSNRSSSSSSVEGSPFLYQQENNF